MPFAQRLASLEQERKPRGDGLPHLAKVRLWQEGENIFSTPFVHTKRKMETGSS